MKRIGRNLECCLQKPALSDSHVRRLHLQPSLLARTTEGYTRSKRCKPDSLTEEEAERSECERADPNSSRERWLLSAEARHDLTNMHNFSIDQIISTSWEKKLADDLATELETHSGEKRQTIEEMRRFLAVKGYREQFRRLQEACEGRSGHEALTAAAHAMRSYALERPALAAVAFRTPPSDCHEWQEVYVQSREFFLSIFADCGLRGQAADQALHILRSLVRGFVLHEIMNTFLYIFSYEESFDCGMRVFIAGLPALASYGTGGIFASDGPKSTSVGRTELEVANPIRENRLCSSSPAPYPKRGSP